MNSLTDKMTEIFGEKLKISEPLARFTTFKVGGPADFFLEVATSDELVSAVTRARDLGVAITVIGGGSNILIGDKGIRGLVIKNNSQNTTIRGIKGKLQSGKSNGEVYVEADAGVILNKLVRFTIDEGLAGLEMHLGLPGTVGGALYMNSKWTHPDGYVGDVVHQATIITPENEVTAVPKSYFHFGYDTSTIQKSNDIVVSVVFALKQSDKDTLWGIANESIRYRRETQPQGIKSAGCTFKNISRGDAIRLTTPNETTSAGFLVDHAGLKGVHVGGASISPVHANFIINDGSATALDVVSLIEQARSQVKSRFGVELAEEIVRLGEF